MARGRRYWSWHKANQYKAKLPTFKNTVEFAELFHTASAFWLMWLSCFWSSSGSPEAGVTVFLNDSPKLQSTQKMKLTLACSLGAFGRSTILWLIVIVVKILIIILCIKPTAIQVVPKLLKITWKPNQLEPLCFLEGKASTSSMVLEKVEKSLCLSCFYLPSTLEESRATLMWKSPRPHTCPNMPGNCRENEGRRLFPVWICFTTQQSVDQNFTIISLQ